MDVGTDGNQATDCLFFKGKKMDRFREPDPGPFVECHGCRAEIHPNNVIICECCAEVCENCICYEDEGKTIITGCIQCMGRKIYETHT